MSRIGKRAFKRLITVNRLINHAFVTLVNVSCLPRRANGSRLRTAVPDNQLIFDQKMNYNFLMKQIIFRLVSNLLSSKYKQTYFATTR